MTGANTEMVPYVWPTVRAVCVWHGNTLAALQVGLVLFGSDLNTRSLVVTYYQSRLYSLHVEWGRSSWHVETLLVKHEIGMEAV